MAKQNKTICLNLVTIKKGEKRGGKNKEYKSFSAYVEHLIIKDNEK